MPDIEGIIKTTNLLLQHIFGKNVPSWISPLINWTLLGGLLLCGLWGLLVLIGKLGLSAIETGALDDRKWALEVSSVAPEPILTYMLKNAFAGKSQWLKEVAYRQVACIHSVHSIPGEIIVGMHRAIINQALDGRLRREHYATRAYLARLPQPLSGILLSSMELLLHFHFIDLEWQIFLFCCFIRFLLSASHLPWYIVILACFVAFINTIALFFT